MPHEMQTPEEVNRFIGGGNIDWAPYTHRAPEPPLSVIGGADFDDSARPALRPAGPPGHAADLERPSRRLDGPERRNTNILNYSINAVHH